MTFRSTTVIWVEEGSEPSRIEGFKTQPQRLKPGSFTSVIGMAEALPSHRPNGHSHCPENSLNRDDSLGIG